MLRRDRTLHRFALALFLMAVTAVAVHAAPSFNRDPDAARIVTEDVDRFWTAWREAAAAAGPHARAEVWQSRYLDRGSAGLREFTRLRIGDGAQLQAVVDAHPRYYAALEPLTRGLERHEPRIRGAMRAMAQAYPEAVFPDVYLLLGRMSSGGTLSETGLLIGLDMYGRAGATPMDELGDWHRAVVGRMQDLPHIVAHELVHYQQRYDGGERTLLAAVLGEGIADFVAELVSGRHINHHVHAWAEPRAAQLWAEFEPQMHGSDLGVWLYDTAPRDGRPADVGYWLGYRIAKAYYDRASDKRAALAAMLNIRDFDAFLAESGFAESMRRNGP